MQEPQQPAAAPADAVAAVDVAPPTIDSHGGKLTPMTCFGCGPDGVTSLLMMGALLGTLAPRSVKLYGRELDLSATRLAPGLLLTAVLAWHLLPSLGFVPDVSSRFQGIGPGSAALGGALLLISFLHLLSDALFPSKERSRTQSLAAMAAAGLAIVALPLVIGLDVFPLMSEGIVTFDGMVIFAGYLGVPAGVLLLLAWRRCDGRLFDILLFFGTIGLLIVGSATLSNSAIALTFLTTALSTMATLGSGLRGMDLAGWQGLTGRMAWVLSWILRILAVMQVGMLLVF